MSTASSTRSRTIDSTSRPTYPTSVNFEASTLMNGDCASRASRRAISVLPTPVGPIIRMFFGAISSAISGGSFCRRVRLRSAIATARLACVWPDDVLVELGDDLLRRQRLGGGRGALWKIYRHAGTNVRSRSRVLRL